MKIPISHSIVCATSFAALLLTTTTQAAFIIEASDTAGRLGEGNFAYTGSVGVPSFSTASAGNLPATTDLPTPTFFTLRHAFGGNGASDQYSFDYSPAADADNQTFAAGTLYNSMGASPDLRSSGLSGGGAGIYNVYRIHPGNPGVSGGTTTYQVQVGSTVQLTEAIDQNAANLATGVNTGRWELIGSVSIPNATDTVIVTMTPEISSYVSMRASGIMFEYLSPIPEPACTALLGLGALLFVGRRRR